MDYEPIKFPGWRYGPNGEAQIFERAEDVPEGWTDNPNDFKPLEASSEAVVDVTAPPADEPEAPATAPVEEPKTEEPNVEEDQPASEEVSESETPVKETQTEKVPDELAPVEEQKVDEPEANQPAPSPKRSSSRRK